MPRVFVIIPAFDEEQSIGKVIQDIPKEIVAEIVVTDNNSKDNTQKVAKQAGATVLSEPQQGYGYACLKAIEYLKQKYEAQPSDIIVFLDGDYSDYPAQITEVIQPIVENNYDMVIGSRALGRKEGGSMTPQQIFGNWLATRLLKLLYKVEFTDLGPFRAIKFEQLLALDMQDNTYGWTVEMQVKAAKVKLTSCEVPVDYKVRIGVSKVSGTLKGTIMAGYKILWTIFKYL